MKNILFCILFACLLSPVSLHAQIEKVIVETYYVSDANDATDTTGGGVEVGSKTYRIYIDLFKGCKIRKIYGDANHALKFSSTAHFFNNIADGQTFAKDFTKNRYTGNTVALDTWLTLGQTTRSSAKTYFGVLKTEDRDGSFIGGINNDGGSAGISTGLLINTDASAGIPLTTNDGMDTMVVLPNNWYDYGIIDATSLVDSTIFGSAKVDSQFVSYNAGLQNSGVSGVNADSNQVLVAQLTTKGDISFELNVEVTDTNGTLIKYVANDSILLAGEVKSRFLKYPYAPVCGCADPNYLEYTTIRDCDSQDSCRNRIVFGCMDTLACNYDPHANFNLSNLCCYPGYCNDRDLSVVCPQLNYGRLSAADEFTIYPNPARSEITLEFTSDSFSEMKYMIYNSFGRIMQEHKFGIVSGTVTQNVNIDNLPNGLYLFRLFNGNSYVSKLFTKN